MRDLSKMKIKIQAMKAKDPSPNHIYFAHVDRLYVPAPKRHLSRSVRSCKKAPTRTSTNIDRATPQPSGIVSLPWLKKILAGFSSTFSIEYLFPGPHGSVFHFTQHNTHHPLHGRTATHL